MIAKAGDSKQRSAAFIAPPAAAAAAWKTYRSLRTESIKDRVWQRRRSLIAQGTGSTKSPRSLTDD